MDFYFSPLACSLATRIALYEAGAGSEVRFLQVDLRRKLVADGSDFLAVNPMGQVPALRTDSGEILTENPAVLQFVADRYPEAGLVPPAGAFARYRAQQWLSFIGTELHKAVFVPLLDPRSSDGAKEFARAKAPQRFAHLNRHLADREYLLDGFGIADAYLLTVLNWCRPTNIDLAEWPAVRDYYRRMLGRPAAAQAVAEERALYEAEQARQKVA